MVVILVVVQVLPDTMGIVVPTATQQVPFRSEFLPKERLSLLGKQKVLSLCYQWVTLRTICVFWLMVAEVVMVVVVAMEAQDLWVFPVIMRLVTLQALMEVQAATVVMVAMVEMAVMEETGQTSQ